LLDRPHVSDPKLLVARVDDAVAVDVAHQQTIIRNHPASSAKPSAAWSNKTPLAANTVLMLSPSKSGATGEGIVDAELVLFSILGIGPPLKASSMVAFIRRYQFLINDAVPRIISPKGSVIQL